MSVTSRPDENNNSSVTIGHVTGGIHGATIAGRDIIVTQSEQEKLHTFLAQAVPKYELALAQTNWTHLTPAQPYKFLYAYELADADIFFGRDDAIDALHKVVNRARLTILHAKSGAGKTSLLHAGLAPRLLQERRLPVYARAYQDPVYAIKQALAPGSASWPALLPQLSLHAFLGYVCEHLSRNIQELVIVLDQFEEFFIFEPERSQRQAFIEAFADVYDDKHLPVRFILALRKDYLSDLAQFQPRIHTIFYNEYRLNDMNCEQAQQAITAPVTKLASPLHYEQPLLDTLLDDLDQSGIELPHLQIICTQLSDAALTSGESSITLAQYEGCGRAPGILGGYLNNVLEKLPGRGKSIAKAILGELVSSEETKRVVGYNTLAAQSQAAPDEFDQVLEDLERARLLRRDEREGDIVYEIAHEYLIGQIMQWSQVDIAFKRVQELLEREVVNWRLYSTPIPYDRLELIYAQRKRLRQVSDEAGECLLDSTLRINFPIQEWPEVLLVALKDIDWNTNSDVHQEAVEALGKLGDDRAVEPLITFLNKENENVRWETVKALRQLGDTRAVEPLIAILGDENENVRWETVEALGQLGDARAVEPLIAILGDENENVRSATVEALGQLGEGAVAPLIAILDDENENVRVGAAEALGQLGEGAVAPLIAILDDENENVRVGAAEALGELGDARAVAPLIAILGDENENVRSVAVRALSQLGDARAVKPLIAALNDQAWAVRFGASYALGQLGDARAVEPLMTKFNVEDDGFCFIGLVGIVHQSSAAVEFLISILNDKDQHGKAHWIAAKVLGTLGNTHAVEHLIGALKDKDENRRAEAASILGGVADVQAVEPLICALNDENVKVRRSAARALGRLGNEQALEPLIDDLKDDNKDVRKSAIEALGKLGDNRAVGPLTAALNDDNQDVRGEAAKALKAIDTEETRNTLHRSN